MTRFLHTLIALALVLGTTPVASAAAEPTELQRTLQDTVRLHLQGFPLIDADATAEASAEAAQKSIDRAIADHQLNLAKAELRQLKVARTLALAQFSEPGEECEREIIEDRYQQEKTRLNEVIKSQRRLLPDGRGPLRKAWHWIGRPGRRIIRAVFEEVAPVVAGGGPLSGGAVRKLAIRAGRRELKNAIVRGLARQMAGRQSAVVAEAREQCQPVAAATLEATPVPTPVPTQAPSTMQGTDPTVPGCTTWESAARLPPYDQPAVLVRFGWDERDDVGVQYHAEKSGNPSNAWSEPFWGGGCRPASGWCNPLHPLVFTTAEVGGHNWESVPGTYTVMALPGGACQDAHEYAYETIPSFAVSAVIEYYEAGASEPTDREELRTVTLRNHVDSNSRTEPNPDRRELGTFEWDPAVGFTIARSVDEANE